MAIEWVMVQKSVQKWFDFLKKKKSVDQNVF